MRALVYTNTKNLSFENIQEEKIKKNLISVGVNYVSICGSDILGYLGKSPGRVPPLILGHEFTGYYKKKNVVVNPIINNKQKNKKIEYNLDNKMQLLGLHIDGAFREKLQVPKKNLIFYDSNKFPSYLMTLTEPLACAVNAVESAKISSNKKVLIIGYGCLGFMINIILKFKKLKIVHVYDKSKLKSNLAKINKSSSIDLNKIKNNYYDIIFDCVGSTNTHKNSLNFVKNGGNIILVGYKEGSSGFDFVEIVRRQISLIGIMAYNNKQFIEAFIILKKKYKIFKNLVKVYPFSSAKTAFRNASSVKNKYLRHIVKI